MFTAPQTHSEVCITNLNLPGPVRFPQLSLLTTDGRQTEKIEPGLPYYRVYNRWSRKDVLIEKPKTTRVRASPYFLTPPRGKTFSPIMASTLLHSDRLNLGMIIFIGGLNNFPFVKTLRIKKAKHALVPVNGRGKY